MSDIAPPDGDRTARLHGDTGANLVEYAMLLALVVIMCLGAVTFFGQVSTDKTNCVQRAVVNELSDKC